MTEPIEGTATEVEPEPETSRALATVPLPTVAVTPQVQASELVERLDMIREAQKKAMQPDVDYGVIPGTKNPTLLKPGAEKLGVLFQLDVQLSNEKEWGPGDHLTVVSRATVYHSPSGTRLGYGEGVCSTREKKYAYRKAERVCPNCHETAVIKGRKEYGGGWLCFKKKGGCGAKWDDGDERVESQDAGPVDNPDLPDTWNTVVKMAEKRARVDAVLAVTGASALFTQDVEDQADTGDTSESSGGVPPDAVQRMEQARQRAREADTQATASSYGEPPAGFDPVTQSLPDDPRDERIDEPTALELEEQIREKNLSLTQIAGMLSSVAGIRLSFAADANPDVKRSAVAGGIRTLSAGQCAECHALIADMKPKGGTQ